MQPRLLLVLMVLAVTLVSAGCKQVKARKAVQTNDTIITLQHDLKLAQQGFFDVLATHEKEEIAHALERLRTAAAAGRRACAETTAPECGKDFLVAAARMFRHYERTAGAEYRQIADWYSRDSVTVSEWNEIQLVVQEAGEQEMKTLQVFREAQVGFAQACGFQLAGHVD